MCIFMAGMFWLQITTSQGYNVTINTNQISAVVADSYGGKLVVKQESIWLKNKDDTYMTYDQINALLASCKKED